MGKITFVESEIFDFVDEKNEFLDQLGVTRFQSVHRQAMYAADFNYRINLLGKKSHLLPEEIEELRRLKVRICVDLMNMEEHIAIRFANSWRPTNG